MRTWLVAVAIAALTVTGCADSGSEAEQVPPPPEPWPLTGLPGPPGDSQVVVVKIENTSGGRPQLGLDRADLVVEELVEGGLTRLAAMYHTSYADLAGPVRSLRETDIGIVLPTGGTLAASGGAPSTSATLEQAGVDVVVDGATGFFKDPNRKAPYNLMLDVAALAATLHGEAPPQPYLAFGDLPQDAAGLPVASVDLLWPASRTTMEPLDSGGWTRTSPPGEVGAFTNIVALTVPVTFGGGTDAAGTKIPTMQTTGSGDGVVITGDRAYEVTWSKASPTAPWSLRYLSEAGEEPFPLPPGRTWLALLPPEGTVSLTSAEPVP